MSIIKLSKEFSKKNWLLLLCTFLFSCGGFVLELIVLPLLTSKITTFSNDIKKVKKYIISLFCIWVLIQICFSVADKLYEMVDLRCKQFVSETLLSYAIIRMDQDPDTVNIAQLYNIIEKVEIHITSLFYYMIRILPRIVSILSSIIILITLQITSGIITLIGYIIILCIVFFFIAVVEETKTEEHKEILLDKMNEEFSNINMIRSTSTAIPLEIENIKQITHNQLEIDIHNSDSIRKKQIILYGCIVIMSALLLYLSYRNYKNNTLSTESFTRIILSIIPLCSQINDIIWFLPDLSKSVQVLRYHNTSVHQLYSHSVTSVIPLPSSCIYTFTDVTFSYPDQEPLLTHFSMVLPNGLIWLRGESGSGKSTFIKLLLGTLTVQEGTITLGDTIVTNAIRHHIIYVHQHAISLFSSTVYDNIMYGITDHIEKETLQKRLQDILQRYKLYSIFGCKEGDDSFLQLQVGKLGEHLSGGQRQMVHLLRCMMMDKLLYIMDEPLTGLDPDTKEIVIQLLTDMVHQGKTIYIISHDELSFPGQHVLDFVKGKMPTLILGST
jgi:ABC-type bacteriocin/lantibiotic exporter with double-glycine peptidase domain